MHRAVLLTGSNEGDSRGLLCRAAALIGSMAGTVALQSSIYQSEPWGTFADTPGAFLNQALAVDTRLTPQQLLDVIHEIENRLGRVRPSFSTQSEKTSQQARPPAAASATSLPENAGRVYTSRTMDIDIIFYDDMVLDTPALQIPHPRAHLRGFVLEPIAEIMPGYVHPLLKKTVAQLASML